jgi:hypothetical protein
MNKARPVKGEKKLVGGRVLGTPEGGAMKIVLDQAACDGSATASSSCLNYWASTSVDSRSSPTVRLPASCCARRRSQLSSALAGQLRSGLRRGPS